MAAIERIIEENTSFAETIAIFKKHPEFIPEFFAPLFEAGFTDFTLAGSGTNSFFLMPAYNDNIVFRASNESAWRRDNIPFFLAGAYEKSHKLKGYDEMRLEVLLAGKKGIPDPAKAFLLNEMKAAGWRTEDIKNPDLFWNDVVMISVRDRNGRMQNIPIVSDPSADTHYLDFTEPRAKVLADGTLCYPNLNRCSSNYITLQDQAAAYNAIIESDPRLRKLISYKVEFPETEVFPAQTAQLSL